MYINLTGYKINNPLEIPNYVKSGNIPTEIFVNELADNKSINKVVLTLDVGENDGRRVGESDGGRCVGERDGRRCVGERDGRLIAAYW